MPYNACFPFKTSHQPQPNQSPAMYVPGKVYSLQLYLDFIISSLRKLPTFRDATTVFPRDYIWETSGEIPLDEANFQPIRSTIKIWVVTCHQYGSLHSFLKCHFVGKPLVASRNVGFFILLRLHHKLFMFLTPTIDRQVYSLIFVSIHFREWFCTPFSIGVSVTWKWLGTDKMNNVNTTIPF